MNVSAAELTGARQAHIGRPLPGVRVYILSEDLKLLPPGVKGELCVAGRGVAPGYLDPSVDNRPAFVPDPFGDGMLYRTGDRGAGGPTAISNSWAGSTTSSAFWATASSPPRLSRR